MKSGVTLQQMLTEVKRQSESKEDYLIAPNRLRMESYGKEIRALLKSQERRTQPLSHSQRFVIVSQITY